MVLDKGICGPKPRVSNIEGTNLKSLTDESHVSGTACQGLEA